MCFFFDKKRKMPWKFRRKPECKTFEIVKIAPPYKVNFENVALLNSDVVKFSEYICSICLDILKDPIQTITQDTKTQSSCGHIFCNKLFSKFS